MRYFITSLLCFFCYLGYCQNKLSIDDQGFIINAFDTRFKAGDSLMWATTTYSDKNWDTFRDTPEQRTTLNKAGSGWFRCRIQGKKRYKEEKWVLIIKQSGNSTIYLDGKRIANVVADQRANSGERIALVQLPVTLPDTGNHVLAIRHQFRDEDLLFADTDTEPFTIRIERQQKSLMNQIIVSSMTTAFNAVITGFFVILALLHFMFYRANPDQRVNLLLGISSLCFACMAGIPVFDYFVSNLREQSVLNLIQYAGLHIGMSGLLTAVYTYLHRSKGWLFIISIALLSIHFGYQWLIGSPPDYLIALTFCLYALDYIRTSWLGKKRGQPGDRLPWNSLRFSFATLSLIILLAILNGLLSSKLVITSTLLLVVLILLFFLFLLSVPIGLSFSLVHDYTHTHASLQQNLDEVQRLSARSLAQEQEKQQILAAQNDTLERLVQERTAALNESIEHLKTTQDQLIQKEKMASLGELTAGIAHEIQNPLNFVNNFSEVSADLIAEIKDEQQRPADDRDEGLVDEILGDLRQNLEKITHHGKRASSIVKGMLEHSRTSAGERQPTDLNALSSEYLRLAYQGYLATHKTFDCQLVTDFDPALPLVNLATQDIGRVILSLLNNAFYALNQKQQAIPDGFQPTVWLSTTNSNATNFVALRIRDNGPGIPKDILGKVFQPFFTTKPTGEGTGLGLSLAYDIITKAYKGDLLIDSTEGEGTTFTIRLPL